MKTSAFGSFVNESNRLYAASIHAVAISSASRGAFRHCYRPALPASYRLPTSTSRVPSKTFGDQAVIPPPELLPGILHSAAAESERGIVQEVATLDIGAMLSLAIELDPCSPYLRIALGARHLDLGDHDRALHAFMSAYKLSVSGPLRSRTLANCAAAYERLDEIDLALQASYQAVSQAQVAPLAVYNHRMLLMRYTPKIWRRSE